MKSEGIQRWSLERLIDTTKTDSDQTQRDGEGEVERRRDMETERQTGTEAETDVQRHRDRKREMCVWRSVQCSAAWCRTTHCGPCRALQQGSAVQAWRSAAQHRQSIAAPNTAVRCRAFEASPSMPSELTSVQQRASFGNSLERCGSRSYHGSTVGSGRSLY